MKSALIVLPILAIFGSDISNAASIGQNGEELGGSKCVYGVGADGGHYKGYLKRRGSGFQQGLFFLPANLDSVESLTVHFDKPVKSLTLAPYWLFNTFEAKCLGNECTFKNDGHQEVNPILEGNNTFRRMTFQLKYDAGSTRPNVIGLTVNGQTLCGRGPRSPFPR